MACIVRIDQAPCLTWAELHVSQCIVVTFKWCVWKRQKGFCLNTTVSPLGFIAGRIH